MTRRLILYRPITEDEARAAGAWAEKLGDERMTIGYRPSPVPMRVLLFDAVSRTDGFKRNTRVRMIPDPAEPAASALREAMSMGDVVFNVFTGREDNRAAAYSGTDAVFTVAFPDGEACAWFARIAAGVAPGIANQCVRGWGGSADFLDAVRHLFFKRRLNCDRRLDEDTVIAFARQYLADIATG